MKLNKTLSRHGVVFKPSTSSLGSTARSSYSRDDPAARLDPVYFGSDKYFRDRMTEVNMAANGSGNLMAGSSPTLLYATLAGFL
jgi:hypothetical protein